jgi:hypothetical protein
VARLVSGQQRGDVGVNRQQVADGVVIFRSVQAAEGVGTAGIGMRGGGAIQRRLERGDDRLIRGFVGARHSGGRHVAPTNLADDLFPILRVQADIIDGRDIQR